MMDVCRELGVERRALTKWKNHPKFTAMVNQMNREYFATYIPDVINAVKDQALAGNIRAAEMFMKWVSDFHTENPEEAGIEEATIEEVRMVIQKIKRKKV